MVIAMNIEMKEIEMLLKEQRVEFYEKNDRLPNCEDLGNVEWDDVDEQ